MTRSGPGVVRADEALRSAMSVPGVAVTVSGVDSMAILNQNLAVARGFTPMTDAERVALRDRVAPLAADGRFEHYKSTTYFDGKIGREQHGLPAPRRATSLISDPQPPGEFMAIMARALGRTGATVSAVGFGGHLALEMLDQSLRRLQTDRLDLWQIHGGRADAIKQGVVSPIEMLRYAMSLPVATTICGIDSEAILKQVVEIATNFTPTTAPEMDALRAKCRAWAGDGRFELYKVSLAYDNPEARKAHRFPVDPKQKEVSEEENTIMGAP